MQSMVSQNQVELMVLEKNMTIKLAIDGTKIKKLEKCFGEINMTKVISFLLMRFSDSFNVGKNLTPLQSAQLAIDIMEKYPYETIEDIVLLLKQVRQGSIGDGKDFKLDSQNVLAKWFPEYLDKKYAEVERLNKQVQDSFISKHNEDAISKMYALRQKKKLQEEKEQKIKEEIDNMTKNMDRQMLEDTIVDWNKKEDMRQYVKYLISKRPSMPGKNHLT